MTSTAFIVVFRPHQRPAWAEAFDSEQHFIDRWINGGFANSCNARDGDTADDTSFTAAWQDVGHDLHGLDRLDSAEDVLKHLSHPMHNRGDGAVMDAARELGWITLPEYQIAYARESGEWDIVETFRAATDDDANEYAEANHEGEWYVLRDGENING